MWGALAGPEKSPPSGPWLGGGYSWKRCHYLMIFCPQVFVKAGSIPRWWWLRWCSAPAAAAEAAWRLVAGDSRAPLVSSLVSGCSSSSPLGSIASAPRPAVGGRWSLGLSLSLSRGARRPRLARLAPPVGVWVSFRSPLWGRVLPGVLRPLAGLPQFV